MDPQENRNPETPPSAPAFPSHPRAWLAGLLVALTAGAGLAARLGAGPSPGAGSTGPATLHFAATGSGPVDLGARLDREAIMDRGDGTVMMELVLRGHAHEGATPPRSATDLVVVLDRSGSMQGEPLVHARASTRELVAGLGRSDRFALVSYANDARVDIPLSPAVDDARRVWRSRLDAVAAHGGTNMARGLDLANEIAAGARAAGRSVRVILISDGHANQGDHTLEGLRARAGRAVSGEFVLTTVGVGDGFDERLMTALADAGTGNFYYVRDVERLASVFGDEFLSARETVARGLALEIEPGAGVSVVDAAGYPLEQAGDTVSVRPGALYAGQERRLWLTFEVDEDRRDPDGPPIELGRVALRYRTLDDTPHLLALADRPSVAVVAEPRDFYAALDAEAYTEQLASDGLGSLRQRVAEAVQAGERGRARRLLDGFEQRNAPVLEGLGYVAEETEAMVEVKQMREEVDAALAPSAPAGSANALGKSLSSRGYDQRRAGAKRK
ncbi:MAG: vWA domain-containing protein [Myxococcota bacterium]